MVEGVRTELDWDRCLCRLLEGIEDDLARRTVRFLQEYRRLAEAYAAADPHRGCPGAARRSRVHAATRKELREAYGVDPMAVLILEAASESPRRQ